jgi:hypothetical protein
MLGKAWTWPRMQRAKHSVDRYTCQLLEAVPQAFTDKTR